MTVVIGVVVHAGRRAVFEEAARTLRGASPEWVVYRHEREIHELVRALLASKRVDGLLMGPVPFDECHDLIPDTLPVTLVRPGPLDLALALSRAQRDGLPVDTVSVDTFDTDVVNEVTGALGLTRAQVRTQPYQPGERTADIADRHLRAAGRDGLVITARVEVSQRLRGAVAVIDSLPVPSTVRSDLHALALRVQSQRANEFRFAAGVFLVADRPQATDMDRARIGLMNLLVNTPELADAWVENRGRRGLVVFAHKALFERVTHNWLTVPALGRAERALGLRVAAGFGIGDSARTCIALAERAAARAEAERQPSGYLIEDSGVIIGPMGREGRPVEFTYRDHDTHIEELAREVGLSPATLSRLAGIERGLAGAAISPRDLANALGITDPSGRRLIRKLGERGLVTAQGSAQTHHKGRPSRLYQLGIDQALRRLSGPGSP
ncbi:hypothetical protein [Amycolatopsis minnesotensis]|uniref:MarR family transcriptional regulator n=1 Tax=Amycolatopsis minnesotensis TaxID=337894 RepID=A0ABN2RKG2_9PSEU